MRQRVFLRCVLLSGLLFCGYGCSGDTAVSNPLPDGGIAVDLGAMSDQAITDAFVPTDVSVMDAEIEPSGPSLIQRIQSGELEEGASVMITNAVVISRGGNEGFFVSDGTQSAYGGIYVFHPNAATLPIEAGNLVTFVGVVKEYFGLTEIVMNADAEVRVDGDAEIPQPIILSMEDLCDAESAEPWEGMLVSVDNLTVTDVAVFGGFTFSGREGGCEIPASPTIAPIDIGQLFLGQSISRVTGLLHYAFETFQILPRDDDDVIVEPLATGVVTIPSVRLGEVPMQSRVTFQGVSVIGVNDYFVYVADPMGGANSGFRITDPDRTVMLAVGDKIDVDLTIQTETTGRLIQTRVTGAAQGPQAVTVSREEFEAPAFQYALVRLEQLTVTQPDPFLEFVEDAEETQVYGDLNAAFEINLGTVSKRLTLPPFPYLRAGDLFDAIEGVLLRHEYSLIQDGVIAEKTVAAIAPRGAADFFSYRPTCDARLCVGDLMPGDLVITEIFYGGACEWIEVKNTRADSVDLTNIRVGERNPDRRSDRPWVFSNDIIEGGSLAIIGCQPSCAEGRSFIESDLGGPLGNEGDVIELWAADLVLDSVAYTPGRTDGIQLDPGTVEGHPGIEIMSENDDPAMWCDATVASTCGVGGTPGDVNSCALRCLPNLCAGDLGAGDLLMTELMVDPSEGGADCEWIELYNTTDQVIELRGLLLVDGETPNLYRSPNLVEGSVQPRDYALIMNDASSCQATCMPAVAASWLQHASLNNSGDTLTLASGDLIVDQVVYDRPPVDGVSLQLDIDQNQWCVSSAVNPSCPGERSTPLAPSICHP